MFFVDGFPQCCAINVIGDLNSYYEEGYKLTPDERATAKRDLKQSTKDNSYVGMVLVAINNLQAEDGFKDILLELGYKLLTEPFFHPGHGHYIYLFGYENFPKKRRGRNLECESRKGVAPRKPRKKKAPQQKRVFAVQG